MNNKSNAVSKFKYPKKGILLTIHYLWKKSALSSHIINNGHYLKTQKEKKKMFAFKTKKTYEEESIQNNAFLFKLSTPIKDY